MNFFDIMLIFKKLFKYTKINFFNEKVIIYQNNPKQTHSYALEWSDSSMKLRNHGTMNSTDTNAKVMFTTLIKFSKKRCFILFFKFIIDT